MRETDTAEADAAFRKMNWPEADESAIPRQVFAKNRCYISDLLFENQIFIYMGFMKPGVKVFNTAFEAFFK